MRCVLMATLAILQLICGSVTIDLLNPNTGYHLKSWKPAVAPYKGGGSYQDSPLADGRRLVHRQRDNWTETFNLELRGSSQDEAIAWTRTMRQFLEDAADYWLGSDPSIQPDAAYIKAQGARETYARYAVITAGQLPEDNNPYAQPFIQPRCRSAMTELPLIVEHGPWLDNVPGSSTCVQVAGTQSLPTQGSDTAAPSQSSDDGWNRLGQESLELATDQIRMGYDTETPINAFIRFCGVDVPAGATILAAWVTFTAEIDGNNDICRVKIWAEQTDDAATWSTYPDYISRRIFTTNPPFVPWPPTDDNTIGIEHWTAGNTYDTPDLSSIIQPIVDRPGWVSGNDVALFFDDIGSTAGAFRTGASWDDPDRPPAVLTVVHTTTSSTFGRAATCDDEVYIANKHNIAQLTNAYYYDDSGAAYSGNLIGAATPFNLLPAAIADADILYIGIDTSLTNTGPFCSVVFDITTAAAYTGSATIDWEYWNGAWVPLSVRDNTGGAGEPFSYSGVNSIHFKQPSDWATTAVNGVTGYWIRGVVDLPVGGDAITTPQQGNRDLYTITWPYVDVDDAQVGGDIPALARFLVKNMSDNSNGGYSHSAPTLYENRVLVGVRSYSRGSRFTPYLNLSDEQNDPGVTVYDGSVTTFVDDTTAPSGRAMLFNPGGALGFIPRAYVILDYELGIQYYGTYHAFLRCKQSGGSAGDIGVKLYLYEGVASIAPFYISDAVYLDYTNEWQVLDLGRVTIGRYGLRASDPNAFVFLCIRANAASGTPNLYMYDLVLMPVDEWCGDFLAGASNAYNAVGYSILDQHYLDIDSTIPRTMVRSLVRQLSNDYVTYPYVPITPGPAIMQANKDQRFWFFCTRHQNYESNTDERRSEPYIANRVQAYRVNRYLSMRGDS